VLDDDVTVWRQWFGLDEAHAYVLIVVNGLTFLAHYQRIRIMIEILRVVARV
jgi:hypothetical protein